MTSLFELLALALQPHGAALSHILVHATRVTLLLGEGSRFEAMLLFLSSLLLCEYASFLLQVLLSLGVVGIELLPSWVLLVLLHLVI